MTNYRNLKAGDVLRKGDQVMDESGDWSVIGHYVTSTVIQWSSVYPFRRPTETIQTSEDGKCQNCGHEIRLPQMVTDIETVKCVKCNNIFIRSTWSSEFQGHIFLDDLNDVDRLRDMVKILWGIIDDIDTYGDIAKSDDKFYRSLVEKKQRDRFESTGIGSDGYKLLVPSCGAKL